MASQLAATSAWRRQRFRLGRIDLSRHDRRAGLVLRAPEFVRKDLDLPRLSDSSLMSVMLIPSLECTCGIAAVQSAG
jgi:hypothetical protein